MLLKTAATLDCDRTLRALDLAIEKSQATRFLLGHRITTLKTAGRTDEWLQAQRDAVEALPKEVSLWRILRGSLTSMSCAAEAAMIQKKIVELAPESQPEKNRLRRMHLSLRHPINALQYIEEKKKAEKTVEKPGATKKPRSAATIVQLKKAVDESAFDEARLLTRRMWRQWPVEGRRISFFLGRSSYTTLWPLERKPIGKETKVKRSRGGLPSALDTHPKKLSFDEQKDDVSNEADVKKPGAVNRQTLEEVLATFEWGRAELERRLRCQVEGSDAAAIYEAQASDLQARGLTDEALARLRAAQAAGTAGRSEFGLMFAILEGSASDSDHADFIQLDELLAASNQNDMGQIRRLANLLAKTGKTPNAAALYQWCALRTEPERRRFGDSDKSLLDDAMKNLEGELKERTVGLILGASRPAPNNYWAEDSYNGLCISTYAKMYGEKEAVSRCAKTIDAICNASQSPSRTSALMACGLLSRQGEDEAALRCLEIGICALPVPSGLRYPWLRSSFERPVRLTHQKLNRVFPRGTKEHPLPISWVLAASRAVVEWEAAGRLHEQSTFSLLAVLTQRLHERGQQDAAQEMLQRLVDRESSSATELLWLADLQRRMGDDKEADRVELELLRAQRLNVERVPEVVARLRQANGAAEAFREAELAATYTLHPDLLGQLAKLAEELAHGERVTHWKTVAVEAAAALKKLKPKKPIKALGLKLR